MLYIRITFDDLMRNRFTITSQIRYLTKFGYMAVHSLARILMTPLSLEAETEKALLIGRWVK